MSDTEIKTDGKVVLANWPHIGLQPHAFAGIFRMLAGEERELFAADIAERGLKQKIVVFEGMILDGRNRYLALVDEGVFEPEDEFWRDRPELFSEFAGTKDEALDFVWSLNEQRRHDSASQRAMSAARYANLRKITQAEAAAKLGVSERQVSSAAKILEEAEPELVEAVDDGRVPAYLAEQLVEREPDEQREVASRPRGEASAAARQTLQNPPPLAESGPVVKAMDANRLVMFAAAVCAVGAAGKVVDLATLDALAREHNMLADQDGTLNLRREADLAFDVARKRMNVGEGDLYGNSLYAVMTADMLDDLDLLIEDYRQAHKLFDQAMRAGDEDRAGEAKLLLAALLWHANGKARGGIVINERPKALVAAADAPLGTAPMWGQNGLFEIEVDGLPALVRYRFEDWGFGPSFMFRATSFNLKFPRGGWVETRVRFADHLGRTVAGAAEQVFRDVVAHHTEAKKTTADDRVGMYFPEFVNRINANDGYDQMERIKRGMELEAGKWPVLPAGGPWPGINSWPANEQECRDKLNGWKSGSKRGFPKPAHLATHIMMVGTRGHLVPVADFPIDEAYVYENNGHWFYVDDGTDPEQGHVARRLTVVTENDETAGESASASGKAGAEGSPSVPADLATYQSLLAAAAELKGAHTKQTAEPLLRAGIAAYVTRAQLAEDLGHPIGTILGWTHKLKLTGLGTGQSAPRPREAAE